MKKIRKSTLRENRSFFPDDSDSFPNRRRAAKLLGDTPPLNVVTTALRRSVMPSDSVVDESRYAERIVAIGYGCDILPRGIAYRRGPSRQPTYRRPARRLAVQKQDARYLPQGRTNRKRRVIRRPLPLLIIHEELFVGESTDASSDR